MNEPAGKCIDDKRIDDERVSEGTQLKQGGRVHTPYSKVGGWGAAASRGAQPNARRGSNEEQSSTVGEEGPERQRDQPRKAL